MGLKILSGLHWASRTRRVHARNYGGCEGNLGWDQRRRPLWQRTKLGVQVGVLHTLPNGRNGPMGPCVYRKIEKYTPILFHTVRVLAWYAKVL